MPVIEKNTMRVCAVFHLLLSALSAWGLWWYVRHSLWLWLSWHGYGIAFTLLLIGFLFISRQYLLIFSLM
jgi:hypothetical protein